MNKLILISFILQISIIFSQQVQTTINDFFMNGSQPNESGSFNSMPGNCGCHEGYDTTVEPMYNWQGSMMAQSARDPLYLATLAVANQDADFSGDLCIRCHSPRGWLSGRSTPTDGSALTANDKEGLYCDICHRAVKPSSIDTNPYPSDNDYTTSTYSADQTYLNTISAHIPSTSANGMYVIDSDDTRRGPYTEADAAATHAERYSPFHRDAYFCGTCHDVSNPVYTKQPDGTYALNDLDTPPPSDDPYTLFPVERTFSEWKMSSFNSAEGVVIQNMGGNKTSVSTCQDCHLRDVTGYGCNKNNMPLRNDLPLHDMTGGNTFVPGHVASLFPDDVNTAALTAAVQRATFMLQNAATLTYDEPTVQVDGILLRVKVTNETGHKLPSGYPEGRRIWLNVRAYSDEAKQNLIYESGAYDASTGVLTHDADAKIYEIKPGDSNGPTFHFVLNNVIHKDNRIPPRGFTNANFEAIQSPPVAYTYADGEYWDYTDYTLPSNTLYFDVNLYYQTTSKEYVEFLQAENTTDDWGNVVYNYWNDNGKAAPVLMESTGNTIALPVELISFSAAFNDESINLKWETATEIDNYGFEVERRDLISDNKYSDWRNIGFIAGSGNSNANKIYSFVDDEIFGSNKFKYRLKQIDNSGSHVYHHEIEVNVQPTEYKLAQNYPNPFNPATTIAYSLPVDGHVNLTVYNNLGEKIISLVDEFQQGGKYKVDFKASNLPSGVYFYKLDAADFTESKKMLLLK